MDTFVQKSILAKLMATENMFIRQGNVSTASFDVKNRVLTVPVLDKNISKDLYDLFMGHECGHALWTSYHGMEKAINDKINMSVLNVVEDSRIERKIKNKYPGIRAPFVRAYSELMEKNFFGTAGKNLEEYNFIDRVNLHCKIGAHLAFKFTPEEKELLTLVESTETFEDCVEVTKKICDYMKEELEEEQKKRPKGDGDGDEPTDYEESDEYEDGSSSNPENEGNGQSDNAEGEEGEESESGSESGKSKTDSPTTQGGPSGGAGRHLNSSENQIRSHTDDEYRKNEHNLFSKEHNNYVYVNIPEFDDSQIMDYKVMIKKLREIEYYSYSDIGKFNKYRQESAKVVSYLVKEFELRKNADQLKRAQTAKTGELNMDRIYSYQFAEDLFKKVTVMPQGKSHGLVMFIDWSGSMSRHIGNTVKQLMNLVLFCKKVNIPYEVYCFIDETSPEYNYSEKKRLPNDLVMEQFALINLLSSRMNAKDFTYAASCLMKMSGAFYKNSHAYTPSFMRLSGTPLNEAVIAAMEIVPKFQKKNRLQIVNTVFLTDGEGSKIERVHSNNGYQTNLNPYTHMVIRDPKTNEEVVYHKDTMRRETISQTDELLKLLKIRTNSHVIGFFVGSLGDVLSRYTSFWRKEHEEIMAQPIENQHMLSYDLREKIKVKFRQDNSVIAQSSGFDDYYILRSNGLDTDDDVEELTFRHNATTRGMANAFSKYAGGKIASRVILNRFIGLIA